MTRTFVVCRVEENDTETPLGTLLAEDWGDAIAWARTLYAGPILVRGSCDSYQAGMQWLRANDAENLARDYETAAIQRMQRRRRTEQQVMAFLQWLYPDPNLRPD